MRKFISLMVVLVGCAQVPSQWSPQKNAATKRMHEEVLAELSRAEGRKPASLVTGLGAKLQDLIRLSPRKFSVYVFPKVSGQHHKFGETEEVYLGKPQAFEVSVIAENPCAQYIKGDLQRTLNPQNVFPAALGQTSERRCAIIEITDQRLRTIDRALLKINDVLKTRLFVDDTYLVHGVDRILFQTRNEVKTVRTLNTTGVATSGGLTLFPVNFPSPDVAINPGNPALDFSQSLDGIAAYQITKHHNRKFVMPKCATGATINYQDEYGEAVKVGWCQGLPWPTYSENSRFISVTQPLSVGGSR